MKVVTFFFSGCGNTEWVVKQFNSIMNNKGHEAISYSVEGIENDTNIINLIKEFDYVGFANPIYGANIPKIMRNFILRFISELENSSIDIPRMYFINTFGYVNGFGFYSTQKIFKPIKIKIIGYINIKLFNSIAANNYIMKITETEVKQIKEKANKRLSRFINHLEKDNTYINGTGPHLLIGKIIRHLISTDIEDNYKSLKVNIDTCTKCMECINECPTSSIEYLDGQFLFSSTCTACMRCYNFCPSCSITIERRGNAQKFGRYKGIESFRF